MPTWISAILGIVSSLLGLAKGVQDENNTAEMKANKEAQTRSSDADKINNEIQKANTPGNGQAAAQDEVRKEFSED